MELYRGNHFCELCAERAGLVKANVPDRIVIDPNCSWARWVDQRSGNGEIRVSHGEIVFAAPVPIVHYIEAHSYLPPRQLLKALEEAKGSIDE